MKKFIYETLLESNVQKYLDTDPHPTYRLVSVSISGSASNRASITWELDEDKVLKPSTGPR